MTTYAVHIDMYIGICIDEGKQKQKPLYNFAVLGAYLTVHLVDIGNNARTCQFVSRWTVLISKLNTEDFVVYVVS